MGKNLSRWIICWIFGLGIASSVYAKPIIIKENLGGHPYEFLSDWKWLYEHGDNIIIAGRCESACTLALKFDNVCVKPNAVLGFHAAFIPYHWPKKVWPKATRLLEDVVPQELRYKLKMPFTSFKMQYIQGKDFPERLKCK